MFEQCLIMSCPPCHHLRSNWDFLPFLRCLKRQTYNHIMHQIYLVPPFLSLQHANSNIILINPVCVEWTNELLISIDNWSYENLDFVKFQCKEMWRKYIYVLLASVMTISTLFKVYRYIHNCMLTYNAPRMIFVGEYIMVARSKV